jgi:hypothetical protein
MAPTPAGRCHSEEGDGIYPVGKRRSADGKAVSVSVSVHVNDHVNVHDHVNVYVDVDVYVDVNADADADELRVKKPSIQA